MAAWKSAGGRCAQQLQNVGCPVSLGIPKDSSGIPEGFLGIPQDSLGTPKGSLGILKGVIVSPGIPNGNYSTLGIPRGSKRGITGSPGGNLLSVRFPKWAQ